MTRSERRWLLHSDAHSPEDHSQCVAKRCVSDAAGDWEEVIIKSNARRMPLDRE